MVRTPTREELAPLKAISLLYVEDDRDIREGTGRCLRRHLRSYHEAPNGQEGLEIFRQYKPDIVLTDVTMPIMDGLEMSRRIKAEDENIPLIAISAHNETDFFVEAIEIGIDHYLLKPTNLDALLCLILKSAQPILKQRALESQEQLIQHLLDLSSSPTLIASNGHPERANKAFLEVLGYSSESALYAEFDASANAALTDSAIKQAEQLDCLKQARNDPDVLRQLLQSGNREFDSFEVAKFSLPDTERSVFTLKPKLH